MLTFRPIKNEILLAIFSSKEKVSTGRLPPTENPNLSIVSSVSVFTSKRGLNVQICEALWRENSL